MRLFGHYRDALSLVALALALFAVATNTQTGWLYLFSAFLGGAVLLHFYIGWRELRGLHGSWRSLQGSALGHVGAEGEVAFTVVAPRARLDWPLLVWVEQQDCESGCFPVRRCFQLRRGAENGRGDFRCSLRLERRGPLKVLRLSVQSWAPFAWFGVRRELNLESPAEVLILPALQRIRENPHEPDSRGEGVQLARASRPGNWGDLRRLRDYASGDDPRWIHWPTSARLGRLAVRENSQASRRSLRLVLDCCGSGQAFEEAVSLCASVLDWCQRQGFLSELLLCSPAGLQPVNHEPMLALARVQPHEGSCVLPDDSQALVLSARRPLARAQLESALVKLR